ncbi:hypothetical protein CEXT_45591 [Caerostris extrusa]|uniref:Uncharacterized protein n=1 Tax=Caerostris extrusa TaxID=172846 RepID=A0AAV4NH60_CAEEX|nr:hypothetical protein CEXT_45591 [Caerostris extrusa]
MLLKKPQVPFLEEDENSTRCWNPQHGALNHPALWSVHLESSWLSGSFRMGWKEERNQPETGRFGNGPEIISNFINKSSPVILINYPNQLTTTHNSVISRCPTFGHHKENLVQNRIGQKPRTTTEPKQMFSLTDIIPVQRTLIWREGVGQRRTGGGGSHHWTGTIRKRVTEIIDHRNGGGLDDSAGMRRTSRAVRENWHSLTPNAISYV